MRRFARILAAAVAIAGSARAGEREPFGQAAPLSASDLAQVRAGFIDMDGVQFSFGVLTQTFLNGQLSLSTQLNVNSPTDVTRAASGVAGLTADGLTTVFQSITPSQVANVVATSASNQTIRQDTAVSVSLQGFDQNQAGYALQHTVSNLNMILGVSMLTRR